MLCDIVLHCVVVSRAVLYCMAGSNHRPRFGQSCPMFAGNKDKPRHTAPHRAHFGPHRPMRAEFGQHLTKLGQPRANIGQVRPESRPAEQLFGNLAPAFGELRSSLGSLGTEIRTTAPKRRPLSGPHLGDPPVDLQGPARPPTPSDTPLLDPRQQVAQDSPGPKLRRALLLSNIHALSTHPRCNLIVDTSRRSDRNSAVVRRCSSFIVFLGRTFDAASIDDLTCQDFRILRAPQNEFYNKTEIWPRSAAPSFVLSRHADSTVFPSPCDETPFRNC